MKKLFISCPMRGRTPEAIEDTRYKMHKMAEIITGEEFEVIASYKPEFKGMSPIACLGESIKMMADADVYIGIKDAYENRGCTCENAVAQAYGIKTIFVRQCHVAPDTLDSVR